MQKFAFFGIIFLIAGWLFFHRSEGQARKHEARVSNYSSHITMDDDSLLIWVYFSDRGSEALSRQSNITERAVFRRQLRGSHVRSEEDQPVSKTYVQSLINKGLRVRHTSRWLNAVSGKIQSSELPQLQTLPFVLKIEPVRSFWRRREHREPLTVSVLKYTKSANEYDSAFYGMSYRQNQLVGVPNLHRKGFAGQGVRIAVLDAGFNLLAHEAFDSLRIVKTWDFVNGDSSVADDPGQMGYGGHGTNVLSVLAGYVPGKLIGPAFRAEYLLAKTENTESETPVEEDNWIAAVEWAEALGADIISSSLGYLDMDAGSSRSYDWTWMSGDSTVITKAANRAAERGLIIVNSAGNEYAHPSHNTLLAPADGFRVIAVGSVTSSRLRSAFSSIGPTTEGRIKPDVMAMGSGVVVASPSGTSAYYTANGTSFSCPMVAGLCAQMLSAFLWITPETMMTALHKTADRNNNPDNYYGYGIVNAERLFRYFLSHTPDRLNSYPNPFYHTTTIVFWLPDQERATIDIYNVLGQRVRRLAQSTFPSGKNAMTWDGKDYTGRRVASGIYFCRIETRSWKKTAKLIYLRN